MVHSPLSRCTYVRQWTSSSVQRATTPSLRSLGSRRIGTYRSSLAEPLCKRSVTSRRIGWWPGCQVPTLNSDSSWSKSSKRSTGQRWSVLSTRAISVHELQSSVKRNVISRSRVCTQPYSGPRGRGQRRAVDPFPVIPGPVHSTSKTRWTWVRLWRRFLYGREVGFRWINFNVMWLEILEILYRWDPALGYKECDLNV